MTSGHKITAPLRSLRDAWTGGVRVVVLGSNTDTSQVWQIADIRRTAGHHITGFPH